MLEAAINFYKHYIGDFQRDTGHLSLTERGAYLCLMHHYYATEKPLPNDHAALCRVAGAITKPEREAVKSAMGFFLPVDSGLMHVRIEAEIQKAGKQADTNRQIAMEREAARKAAREGNEQSTNRATNRDTKREPNQTPDTITSITESVGESATDVDESEIVGNTLPSPAGRVCKLLRKNGCPDTNPGHPDLLALIAAGATDDEFIGAAVAAQGKDKPFAYAIRMLTHQRETASRRALHVGPLPEQETPGQRASRLRIEAAVPGLAAKRTAAPVATLEVFDVAARRLG